MDLILIVCVAGMAFGFGWLTFLVMAAKPSGETVRTGTDRGPKVESLFLRIALQIARALAPLHKGAMGTPAGMDYERKLKQAGRPFDLTVPELLATRWVGLFFGALLGYALAVQMSDYADPTYIIPLAIFGFLYPTMKLKSTIAVRRLRLFRDMPYVLDLLTLSTEAGQDFSSAMATVVEKGPDGPLVEEFRIAQQEVTLGKTRSDSLRDMASRIDLPELTSFVLALIQAEQLGASVGNVLRIMSEQMRTKRWNLAEEMAGKVPVKLMLPLVACIFPASFLVLFVPIYLQYQMAPT